MSEQTAQSKDAAKSKKERDEAFALVRQTTTTLDANAIQGDAKLTDTSVKARVAAVRDSMDRQCDGMHWLIVCVCWQPVKYISSFLLSFVLVCV
jgi:hypothetical protein